MSALILPFPSEIDRLIFAQWISGFTDGEACFVLSLSKNRSPKCQFTIVLRQDDRPILELIRSFWQCGLVYNGLWRGRHAVKFDVCRIADLKEIIVPHFERYPLFAKKRHDFEIWKKGVALCFKIAARFRRGHLSWFPENRAAFKELADALKAQRQFDLPQVNSKPACRA